MDDSNAKVVEYKNTLLRQIPKVDELLANVALSCYKPNPFLTQVVREVLDDLRNNIRDGYINVIPNHDALACESAKLYNKHLSPSLGRVINGTGIILHTNLGRAPISKEALVAACEASRGYSTLEYNVSKGERCSRHKHVEDLLVKLTGAEAAMAVNNNAAAVLLALSAVATGKDVIVSRGELVEIGGGFRVPDVLVQSGCRLLEVGTTNKTRPSDYENAIDPDHTGALLRVHTSNFTMSGFVSNPELSKLAAIAAKHNIPLIEDLGSGCLMRLVEYGIMAQPIVSDSIKANVDIVTFSGDKLLGGPQAGLIVGREKYISKMKTHPLARALRIDKLCLAALEATLRQYLDPKNAIISIPTLQMLCQHPAELLKKAQILKAYLEKVQIPASKIESITGLSQAGGGAMPQEGIPSTVLTISCAGISAQTLECHFRGGPIPVIGRIAHGQFILDVRTIDINDFPLIAERFASFFASHSTPKRSHRITNPKAKPSH